jgi:microsomal dipeptidase-like Zn-dependent dipeptidase
METQRLDRRRFLQRWIAAGLGCASSGMAGALLGCSSGCPRSLPGPRHSGRVLADVHAHPLMNSWIKQSAYGQVPFLSESAEGMFNKTAISWKSCHDAGIDLLCVAHFNVFDEWATMPADPSPEAPRHTVQMMNMLEDELAGDASPYAKLAKNAEELQGILGNRRGDPSYRVAVIHAIEGGHALGGDLHELEHFARRGVALMTVAHFFNKGIASAANAYPFFVDCNTGWPHQGLSEFGENLIHEMERLRVIVDVTHATSTAVESILNIARRPLMASHSSARTLADHAYSLFDEHIAAIASCGGFVGIPLYPYMLSNYATLSEAEEQGSLMEVVRTIRHVVKICGNDHTHVGIGSDFAGYIPHFKEMGCLGEIDALRNRLLTEFGRDESVVEDIMANNAINFILKTWGPLP